MYKIIDNLFLVSADFYYVEDDKKVFKFAGGNGVLSEEYEVKKVDGSWNFMENGKHKVRVYRILVR